MQPKWPVKMRTTESESESEIERDIERENKNGRHQVVPV